jgi:hypothetical protein
MSSYISTQTALHSSMSLPLFLGNVSGGERRNSQLHLATAVPTFLDAHYGESTSSYPTALSPTNSWMSHRQDKQWGRATPKLGAGRVDHWPRGLGSGPRKDRVEEGCGTMLTVPIPRHRSRRRHEVHRRGMHQDRPVWTTTHAAERGIGGGHSLLYFDFDGSQS